MLTSHKTLKLVRQIHLYVGLFISPALLFFAFTGAMQTFSLHETTRGSSYKPPAWIVTLAQVHKKQTATVPVRKLAPPGGDKHAVDKPTDEKAKADGGATAPKGLDAAALSAPKPKSHLPMKIFFLLVAIGLFTSTVTGIYMAYKFNRSKVVVTVLLVAGVVVPLLLLPF
jgi:hypothetical protein